MKIVIEAYNCNGPTVAKVICEKIIETLEENISGNMELEFKLKFNVPERGHKK